MSIPSTITSRTAQEWSAIAGSPIEVEKIGDTVYGFGTPVAVQDVYDAYDNSNICAVGTDPDRGPFFSLSGAVG
jgi:hypothetical protein